MVRLEHGAQAPAIVALRSPDCVQELEDAVVAAVGVLHEADRPMLQRAGVQLARLRMLDEYLDRLGGSPIDTRGRVRRCMPLVMSLETQFLRSLQALGLTPAARGALLGDLSSADRNRMLAREAQERLRSRHQAAVAAETAMEAEA